MYSYPGWEITDDALTFSLDAEHIDFIRIQDIYLFFRFEMEYCCITQSNYIDLQIAYSWNLHDNPCFSE